MRCQDEGGTGNACNTSKSFCGDAPGYDPVREENRRDGFGKCPWNLRSERFWQNVNQLRSGKVFVNRVFHSTREKTPNDPSSATRLTRTLDCSLDALAGFAAVHG